MLWVSAGVCSQPLQANCQSAVPAGAHDTFAYGCQRDPCCCKVAADSSGAQEADTPCVDPPAWIHLHSVVLLLHPQTAPSLSLVMTSKPWHGSKQRVSVM